MRSRRRHFTLIEVLIALAVLALGVLTGSQLLFAARERSRLARTQWEEQHVLAQAAEYFLLAGIDEAIPGRFFPFPDYRVEVLNAPPAGLPPGVPERKNGWQLTTLQIELRDREGRVLRELAIDRLLPTGEKSK